VHGATIAPGELAAERDDYGQVVLAQRRRAALTRLNPTLPGEASKSGSDRKYSVNPLATGSTLWHE